MIALRAAGRDYRAKGRTDWWVGVEGSSRFSRAVYF